MATDNFVMGKKIPTPLWPRVPGLHECKVQLWASICKLGRHHEALLLYGPPGIGKTYLIKELAKELNPHLDIEAVSGCDLVSKWRQQDAKAITDLFNEESRVVFIDDLEQICIYSKDIRDKFYRQLSADKRKLIIAATNKPKAIDKDLLEKFDGFIAVTLPDQTSRSEIFKLHLRDIATHDIADSNFVEFGNWSEGFTPADISVVCRDAAMEPLRELLLVTHFKLDDASQCYHPCSPNDANSITTSVLDLSPEKVFVRPLGWKDVQKALLNAKPSISDNEKDDYYHYNK